MDGKKLCIDELDSYLNNLDMNDKKKEELEELLSEAFAYGADIFIDDDYIKIIAKVPEIMYDLKNDAQVVGIYFSMNVERDGIKDAWAWVAIECKDGSYQDGHNIGKVDFSKGFKNAVYQKTERSHCCDYCGKPVGIQNLIHVAFATGVCKDCWPEAHEKEEYPGWYN